MLSQTGIYALQALLHLAARDDRVSAGEVAERLGIPSNYLAKVLQRLGQEGIVDATRGRNGGYRLSTSAESLSVADIIAPFQELHTPETCLMGGSCNPENPCSAHRHRVEWNAAIQDLLRTTSLSDLLGRNGDSVLVAVGSTEIQLEEEA
jgi:Rrf2 family protein